MRRPAIMAGVLLGAGRPALANPGLVGTGFSAPEFTALLGEALFVALLLAVMKFRFVKTLFTWSLVTLATYWLFMLGGGMAIACINGVLRRSGSGAEVPPLPVLILFEVGVILVEAYVITDLASHRSYRNAEEPFSRKSALSVALAGNLVSIAIGAVWMLLAKPGAS